MSDRRAMFQEDPTPQEQAETLAKVAGECADVRPLAVQAAQVEQMPEPTPEQFSAQAREKAFNEWFIQRYDVRVENGLPVTVEKPLGQFVLAKDHRNLKKALMQALKEETDNATEAEEKEQRFQDLHDVIMECVLSTPSRRVKKLCRKLAEARRDKQVLIAANNELAKRVRGQSMALQAQADAEVNMMRQIEQIRETTTSLAWFQSFDRLAKAVHELMTRSSINGVLICQEGGNGVVTGPAINLTRDSYVALIGARDAVQRQQAEEKPIEVQP